MRLFVCHASEDKPQVRELVDRLRADGFDPWFDEERLLPGHDWQLEIAAAVQASDVVVVCLSRTSVVKTGYVQKELRRVLDLAEYQPQGRIFVIPVRLEECPVPPQLRQWQYADLFIEHGYDRLRHALKARAERRDEPAIPALSRPGDIKRAGARRRRRALPIATGAILLTAIAGAVAWRIWLWNPPLPMDLGPSPSEPAGMVRIPGGRFLMGRNGSADPDASPAHETTVQPFYLDRVPVTNVQFRGFLRSSNRVMSDASAPSVDGDGLPATLVTWDEAAAYCLAQGKRLPTEPEWEFAARATSGALYPWGEIFDPALVNSRKAGIGHPEPVGSRPWNRSPFGVADMSGNVWQWCADDYQPYAGRTPEFDIPAGAKVIRGGSYQSDRLHVTAVTRNLESPSKRSAAIGFRCAK